ncbi:MAG: Two-component system response regulatory protein [Parcubacteria group bacterium GW2011_GWD2_38_11]|nr:MAG: Two-component system response regulatory protein [Parcubacteria group bacterium GW2011_GWD2_38_11]
MLPAETRAPTLRILLAEDEIDCTKIIQGVLEKLGYTVTCCTDGSDALNALKNLPFDLAILDIKMPKINGVEIVKIVQELNKNLPIILMSGLSKDEIAGILSQLSTPKLYCISKPILIIDLIKKIDSIFGFNRPKDFFK